MSLPTVCISIRQPWAWLILHAGKDIENRRWPTNFRGRVLIHASKGMTPQEYDDAITFSAIGGKIHPAMFPPIAALPRGGIVGEVEIVGCTTSSVSGWFVGPYGFVLRNPNPLAFLPCRGALGFFNLPLGVAIPSDGGHL